MLVKAKNKILTASSEETESLGIQLATELKGNEVITLSGDLGAGKTIFVKGAISSLIRCHPNEITSPTFNYLNIYQGVFSIYHFDLYRLTSEAEFEKSGFLEYLHGNGIRFIEWPEKISQYLPSKRIQILIEHDNLNQRLISIIQ